MSDDRELLTRLGEALRSSKEPPDGRVEWLRREVASRGSTAAVPVGGNRPLAIVAAVVAVAALVAGIRQVQRRRGRGKRRRVVRVVIPPRRLGDRNR